jgi:hypothetical protein
VVGGRDCCCFNSCCRLRSWSRFTRCFTGLEAAGAAAGEVGFCAVSGEGGGTAGLGGETAGEVTRGEAGGAPGDADTAVPVADADGPDGEGAGGVVGRARVISAGPVTTPVAATGLLIPVGLASAGGVAVTVSPVGAET